MAEPLYPTAWDRTTDIRIFRAPEHDWEKLSVWSADMKRRGWRLLRVVTERQQLVAIFGRARDKASSATG
jgi:hypothetical protein